MRTRQTMWTVSTLMALLSLVCNSATLPIEKKNTGSLTIGTSSCADAFNTATTLFVHADSTIEVASSALPMWTILDVNPGRITVRACSHSDATCRTVVFFPASQTCAYIDVLGISSNPASATLQLVSRSNFIMLATACGVAVVYILYNL